MSAFLSRDNQHMLCVVTKISISYLHSKGGDIYTPLITSHLILHFISQVSKSSNIQCVSVPSGDQTLSYIHVLQKPFLRVQSLGQQVGEHQVTVLKYCHNCSPSKHFV